MTFYITRPVRQRRYLRTSRFPTIDSDLVFPVDIQAKEDHYIVSAVLPGVEPDEVEVQVTNDTLSIKGEIKYERSEEDVYLLKERASGHFSRVIALPDVLDNSKAEASLKNGILTLRIHKAEEALPKKIEIKTKKQ